jgi:hypothetical protein
MEVIRPRYIPSRPVGSGCKFNAERERTPSRLRHILHSIGRGRQTWDRVLSSHRGRLVKHARYYWLLLAENHLTRRLVRKHAAADGGAAGASRVAEELGK